MTSLNIVAHPDDDLLFLNPDILGDLEHWDTAYVLYMTWGDDGHDDTYVDRKRNATRHAYNNGTGYYFDKAFWIKSNSLRSGDIYGDLYRMWQDSDYTADSLLGYACQSAGVILSLRRLIETLKPDLIRTHDPEAQFALLHGDLELDHIDHVYTAKFVQSAAQAYPDLPLYAYTGYPIRYLDANLGPELAQRKLSMWRRYQEIDTEVAGEQWDVAASRCYKRRLQ